MIFDNSCLLYGNMFKYACLKSLMTSLQQKNVNFSVDENPAFIRSQVSFECLSDEDKRNCMLIADAGIRTILDLDPRFTSPKAEISIKLNPLVNEDTDNIDIECKDVDNWTIGICCNKTSTSKKHIRLFKSENSDYVVQNLGDIYFHMKFNTLYTSRMKAHLSLISLKRNESWSKGFENKSSEVYMPILNILIPEIQRACDSSPEASANFIKNLFGNMNKYCITTLEKSEKTKVSVFSFNEHPNTDISTVKLPSKLLNIRPKESKSGEISQSTVTLFFDEGWQIDMRLHNTSPYIQPNNIVFDVTLQQNPFNVYQIQTKWA